jgi:ribosomal protein L22
MAKIQITLPDAKARARQAHQAARKGDAVAAALYDRIYATAVACAEKRPERVAAVMFVRAAICLEVLAEMKGWPAGRVPRSGGLQGLRD